MEWIEVTVNTSHERIYEVSEKLEDLGAEGLVIEDEEEYSDFLEQNKQYWDYVDEDFAASIAGLSRVKFYMENTSNSFEKLETIKNQLPKEKISHKIVRDEDWENNWKEYYKPLPVGDKLLIVPQWEEVSDTDGRAVLKLDPGLIFGTGAHATTQMCLRSLEKVAGNGKNILDLGCGSGILAIAAMILGVSEAYGCDIDPKAPDVAWENAALNGISEGDFHIYAGDILSDLRMKKRFGERQYDIVTANIVADVIIALVPLVPQWLKDDGVFITSGIIDGRETEVKSAIVNAGLEIEQELRQDDWHCFVCKKA